MIRVLARDTTLWTDDVWVADSTPVDCGRSRETVKRSDLAGWAEYGYCASHSRYFWGLRLHLVGTLGGLPVLFALTGAKADERETLLGDIGGRTRPDRLAPRADVIGTRTTSVPGSRPTWPHAGPAPAATQHERARPERPSSTLFPKPLRQTIESINQTLKAQLDLERHGGRTPAGVIARVLQRILARTAAIWHNDITAAPIHRSLTAYDH